VSGVVAAIICGAFVRFFKWLKNRSSGYTGIWVSEILDPSESFVEKCDIWKLKHNKSNGQISADDIFRIFPEDDKHSYSWKAIGVVREAHLIFVYWGLDRMDSRGCVLVTLDDTREHKGLNVHKGLYIKPEAHEIVSRKIRLTQQPRGVKLKGLIAAKQKELSI